MKILIVIPFLFLLIPCEAFDILKETSYTTIYVTMKNNETYTFFFTEYKIFKKEDADFIMDVDKTIPFILTEKKGINLNRVYLIKSHGPIGMREEVKASTTIVKEEDGNIGAVGFDRMLNDRWSINGQAQSNGTVLFGLGLVF